LVNANGTIQEAIFGMDMDMNKWFMMFHCILGQVLLGPAQALGGSLKMFDFVQDQGRRKI